MATMIIPCKADTGISFNKNDWTQNLSRKLVMQVGRVLTSSSGYACFLQFYIPDFMNKQVTKAELKVHCSCKYRKNVIGAAQYNIPININLLNGESFLNKYADNDMAWSPTEITADYNEAESNEWVIWDITSIVLNTEKNNDIVIGLIDLEEGRNDVWNFETMESEYKPFLQVDYNDAVPDAPDIIYPNGDIIEKGEKINFEWKHNSIYDSGQRKYDFGWRQQGAISWNEALGVSSATENRTMDTGSMPTGIIEWRVRTYNAINAVSEYAYGSFELTGRPVAPIIVSMKNDAITEITWKSNQSETAVYRLKIYKGAALIHDSGDMPGGLSSSYIPNMIFPNGQYTVKLRIGSVYGIWSDESAKVFNISPSAPAAPNIILSSVKGGIMVTTDSGVADKILYRSEDNTTFIPIARFTGLSYIDYTVKSDTNYQYFIRAHNGGYSDSIKQSLQIKYTGALLSKINKPDTYIELYKSDSDWFNTIKVKKQNESELIRYEGRIYPVKESGIHRETELNTSFYLDNLDIIKFENMYKDNDIYLFRDRENCFCCDISDCNYENTLFNRGKKVQISLTRIDYDMEVRFDV